MSDRLVVALAVAVGAGAWVKWAGPWPLVAAAVVAAILSLGGGRRAAAVVLAAGFVVSGWLAARAWDGLSPVDVAPASRIDGVATLVGDPESMPGGTRVDLRIEGMRLRATAPSSVAALHDAAAGERWRVAGRYSALDDVQRVRLASRHIAGRLRMTTARRVDGGGPASVIANAFRRVLLRGTRSLSHDQRALFAGVVLGDDRDQNPTEVEDFRASGLTHLLAVSGQNVVFLLAVLGPALRRIRLGARYGAVVGALVIFGTVTRWEPSVTRAVGMAGITVLAGTLGRDVSSLRVLAIAVSGLVLVDPLLVHSIGFALSVAACVGLAVIAPRLRTRMPEILAATIAAQLAVLPVLLPIFGPVPVVSIAANVLAGPVAGPLMMWGLTAGTLAGILDAGGRAGEVLAALLHVPTRVMLEWLSGVARWSADLDVAWLSPRAALVLALAVAAVVVATAAGRSVRPTAVATVVAVVAVAIAATALRPAGANGALLDTSGHDRLWRTGATTVVTTDGAAPPGRLLGALRARNVRTIDVLVVTGSSRAAGRSLGPVVERLRPQLVLGPANTQVPRAVAVETPAQVTAGPFRIDIHPEGKRLTVRIGSSEHAPRARPPRVRHHDAGPRDGDPQPHARLVLRPGGVLRPRRLPSPRRGPRRRRCRPPRRRRSEGRARPGGHRGGGARARRARRRGPRGAIRRPALGRHLAGRGRLSGLRGGGRRRQRHQRVR